MSRVILFVMDDTLVPKATVNEKTKELFFPKTTKLVINQHLKNGDHVVIASAVISTLDIMKALDGACIDCSQIQIFGTKETCNWKDPDWGTTEKLALAFMKDKDAKSIVIVDHNTKINTRVSNVLHVQVPFNVNHNAPPSDAYLRASLLPDNQLIAIKPFVRTINTGKERVEQIDSNALDNYYQLLLNLIDYRARREQDSRDYFTFWASWFGGEARSRNAKLAAVDTIISSLTDGTLDESTIPEAAKNGELSTIVDAFLANTERQTSDGLNALL